MLELLQNILELRRLMLEPHQLMFIQGLLDLALAPVIGAVAKAIIPTPVMRVLMHKDMSWILMRMILMRMILMNIEKKRKHT